MPVRDRRCPYCGKKVNTESKFCFYCGKELPAEEKVTKKSKDITCPVCGRTAEKGAKFCVGCGHRFDEKQSVKEKKDPVCPHCGAPVNEDSKFCLKCGKALKADTPKPKKTSAVPVMPKPAVIPEIPAGVRLSAVSSAGEMDLGGLGNTISSAVGEIVTVREEVSEVLSPLAGIAHTLGSYLGGIFGMFKRPKVLLYTVFMAALWTVLSVLKDSGSEFIQGLSWLTCAEGGILAKACTAVLLSNFASGGIGDTFKGIGSLFRKEGKGSLIGWLIGMIIGAVFCIGFTGFDSASSMAGISGALISLQAIGRKHGNLYDLARSLTSGKVNGERIVQTGKAKSLLFGISAGFALMAAAVAMGM